MIFGANAQAMPNWIDNFYLNVGATQIDFDSNGIVTTDVVFGDRTLIEDLSIPNSTVSVEDVITPSFEIGYFLTRNVSIAATLGVPPTSTIKARGSLRALGDFGDVWYGPPVIQARYHFNVDGRISPYIGVAATYVIVFDEEEDTLERLQVDNHAGWGVTAGVNVKLTENIGVFADVKKIELEADNQFKLIDPESLALLVKGDARVKLDPTVYSAGLSFRF
ncbi:outer membrane protein [Parvularcula bermudensis HTCC2503]|uniref:Outer membrane protein n=2 Tax=Parvularcula TaxID=208215 RepID=E0TGV8_PARBH|nr:outer membrane protein [Parvularcula bermudensis HTCC2503]